MIAARTNPLFWATIALFFFPQFSCPAGAAGSPFPAEESETCRCPANATDGLTGCCLDEEHLFGLCYQKCSVLTQGQYPYRTASNTCCNSPVMGDCLLWGRSKSEGIGCSGYGVDVQGACPSFPCQYTQRQDSYNGDSAVGRWAYGLTFAIPSTDEWGPMAQVDGGNCTHFAVEDIKATDFTRGTTPEVGLQISGVRLECHLTIGAGSLLINFGFHNSSIYLRAAVAPVETDEPGVVLPLGKVTVSDCAVTPRLSYVDFGGSTLLWPTLRNLREDIIVAVQEHAGSLACLRIKPLLESKASEALAALDTDIEAYLSKDQQALTKAHKADAQSIHWDEFPPMTLFQTLLKERNVAARKIEKKIPMINVTLDSTFSAATDGVTANITLNKLQLAGLDSILLDSLVLQAHDERLRLGLTFGHLDITLNGRVTLNPLHYKGVSVSSSGPLHKNISITMNIRNATMGFALLAQVSENRLDSLGVDQLQQVACLFSCMTRGALPKDWPLMLAGATFNTTVIPTLVTSMHGDLESDFGEAIDVAVGTIVRGYLTSAETILPSTIEALAPKMATAMDDYLEDMPMCRQTQVYKGPPRWLAQLMLGTATFLVAVSISLVLCYCCSTCCHKNSSEDGNEKTDDDDCDDEFFDSQPSFKDGRGRVDSNMSAMSAMSGLTRKLTKLREIDLDTELVRLSTKLHIGSSRPSLQVGGLSNCRAGTGRDVEQPLNMIAAPLPQERSLTEDAFERSRSLGLAPNFPDDGQSYEDVPLRSLLEEAPEDVPLVQHRVVPPMAKIICMCILCAALSLFLYADTDLGTVINVVITSHGQSITIGPAFAFSIGTCVRDALKAGAYLFAFVVAGLSAVWPLIKLGLMLYCWLVSPAKFSVAKRQKLLRFLDTYGKYSLIDSWLSILALESYKIEWFNTDRDVSVMVDAVPMMAFFSFVLATVLSLIMGHVTTIMSHLSAEADSGVAVSTGEDVKDQLLSHVPRSTGLALLSASGIVGFLVVAGAYVDTFAITTSGVFSSVILDSTDAVRAYSLVELGSSVTKGAVLHNGSQMVQLIFFAFTVFIPIGLSVSLLILWLTPMTSKRQRQLLIFCECLDAWAAFDVFGLAVVVAWMEFGVMASFLVYHDNIAVLCSWVRDTLDSECFHIDCQLTPGFALLAIGGFASYLLPKIAFRYAHEALEEKSGEVGSASRYASTAQTDEDDSQEAEKSPRSALSSDSTGSTPKGRSRSKEWRFP